MLGSRFGWAVAVIVTASGCASVVEVSQFVGSDEELTGAFGGQGSAGGAARYDDGGTGGDGGGDNGGTGGVDEPGTGGTGGVDEPGTGGTGGVDEPGTGGTGGVDEPGTGGTGGVDEPGTGGTGMPGGHGGGGHPECTGCWGDSVGICKNPQNDVCYPRVGTDCPMGTDPC